MMQLLKTELLKRGYKAEIIPASYLDIVRQDAKKLEESGILNGFQVGLVNDFCNFKVPELDFEIRSIIVVASPSPSTVTVKFNWSCKTIPLRIPSTYVDYITAPYDIEKYLVECLGRTGAHAKYDYRLPRKWLAAISGLGVYGRNNICYVDGMGSFANITSYYSDIPCAEGRLYAIRQMEECGSCKACLNNCPTAAIRPDSFLIDNERCLTYFNEMDGDHDFPEWIDAAAHNSLVGCTRCQLVCPVNRKFINNVNEALEFSEEETGILLSGVTFEKLPEELAQKIEKLNMRDYLSALPRNLKAIFNGMDRIGPK